MGTVKTHVGPVYLEPKEHVYINKETGEKYTSVTKIIKHIVPPFEADQIAEAIERQGEDIKNPKYLGMNKHQILAEWDRECDEANTYGTMVHEIVEDYLLANKIYKPKSDFEKVVIKAYNEMEIDEGETLYPERIMFSPEYKLAGMTDVLVDLKYDLFDIGDWKTNKEFSTYSKYRTFLLPPFEHLQDCHLTVYNLQLSTYALMYEMETGKKCRQLWAGHFDRNTNKFTKVPMVYLKNEALKLLKIHEYNRKLEEI